MRNLGKTSSVRPHDVVLATAEQALAQTARRNEEDMARGELCHAVGHRARRGVDHVEHGAQAGHQEQELLADELHVASGGQVDLGVGVEDVEGR